MAIKIDDISINRVQNTKFLGVNSNLTWNDHVKCITNKVNKNIGIFQCLWYIVPVDILKTLYFTLFLPYLIYCNINSESMTSVYLDKLFLRQKKGIRIIGGAKWCDRSMPIFVHLGLFAFCNVNNFTIYCFMFKIQQTFAFILPKLV